jgi:ATP-dependent protease HslVU (ClpYQ) ATPase subunit
LGQVVVKSNHWQWRPTGAGAGASRHRQRRAVCPGRGARQKFRKKLREGALDDKEIEIEVAQTFISMEILSPPGMEDLGQQLQSMFQSLGGGKKRTRRMFQSTPGPKAG